MIIFYFDTDELILSVSAGWVTAFCCISTTDKPCLTSSALQTRCRCLGDLSTLQPVMSWNAWPTTLLPMSLENWVPWVDMQRTCLENWRRRPPMCSDEDLSCSVESKIYTRRSHSSIQMWMSVSDQIIDAFENLHLIKWLSFNQCCESSSDQRKSSFLVS